MNAGVSTRPRGNWSRPRRAAALCTSNSKFMPLKPVSFAIGHYAVFGRLVGWLVGWLVRSLGKRSAPGAMNSMTTIPRMRAARLSRLRTWQPANQKTKEPKNQRTKLAYWAHADRPPLPHAAGHRRWFQGNGTVAGHGPHCRGRRHLDHGGHAAPPQRRLFQSGPADSRRHRAAQRSAAESRHRPEYPARLRTAPDARAAGRARSRNGTDDRQPGQGRAGRVAGAYGTNGCRTPAGA